MNTDLNNKVAVVTGGNGTLGRAFVTALGAAGARVFILGRNEEKSAAAVADFRRLGHTVDAIRCDVLDEGAVAGAVEDVMSRAGRVDILVNGAGGNQAGAVVGPDSSIFDLKMDAFRSVNDLNLLGTVIPSIAFAKPMVEAGAGCIVNVSSMAALLPITRVVGYSAAKAAVDNFTRWLAVELAHKYGAGIRVNAIAPGFFIADQNRDLLLRQDGSLTARGETIIGQTPAGRFGRPEELQSTLLWLCSDASSFVNGIVVPVDGGFSAFCGV